MLPKLKRAALAAAGLLVLIQAYRPSRTNPPIDPSQEITAAMNVDAGVKSILDRSCNDCHSNRTVWPWYSGIAPISWGVASDVRDGRRHMNLSEWGSYPDYKRQDVLNEACKMVTQRDMPPLTYGLVHRQTRLSESEQQTICRWTKAAAAAQLSAIHN